jgi:hypothetical protein
MMFTLVRLRPRPVAPSSYALLFALGIVGCGAPDDAMTIAPRVFDDDFADGDLDGWTAHNPQLANAYVGPDGLVLEPNAWTYWFNTNQSVQYYQLATGDFAITADVTVTSLDGTVVQPSWRVGAIQIRNPALPPVDAYHAGFGQIGGGQSPVPIFETKNTDNSLSAWWTEPNATGTGQVRVCRAGSTVRSMWRAAPEDPWILGDERERGDLPQTLAVGPIAFNGNAQANLRATFDDIRWHTITAITDCGTLDDAGGDDDGGGSSGVVEVGSSGVVEGGSSGVVEGGSSGGVEGGSSGVVEGGSSGVVEGGSTGVADGSTTAAADEGAAEVGGGSTGVASDDGADGGGGPACVSSFDGTGDIAALDDEFDDPATLGCWTFRSDVEGTTPQFTDVDIDASNTGHFTIVPTTCGWFNDFDGPFIYKEVTGDFMFEVSVAATSLDDPNVPPSLPFNSAGMMVRSPDTGPGNEDHVLFSVGAQWNALLNSEGKNTVNSASQLTQTAGPNRGRLRICRIGSTFYLARRLQGAAAFTLTHTYVRADMPATVQAGMEATAWNGHMGFPNFALDPDLVGTWDYVRFSSITDPAQCLAE